MILSPVELSLSLDSAESGESLIFLVVVLPLISLLLLILRDLFASEVLSFFSTLRLNFARVEELPEQVAGERSLILFFGDGTLSLPCSAQFFKLVSCKIYWSLSVVRHFRQYYYKIL